MVAEDLAITAVVIDPVTLAAASMTTPTLVAISCLFIAPALPAHRVGSDLFMLDPPIRMPDFLRGAESGSAPESGRDRCASRHRPRLSTARSHYRRDRRCRCCG